MWVHCYQVLYMTRWDYMFLDRMPTALSGWGIKKGQHPGSEKCSWQPMKCWHIKLLSLILPLPRQEVPVIYLLGQWLLTGYSLPTSNCYIVWMKIIVKELKEGLDMKFSILNALISVSSMKEVVLPVSYPTCLCDLIKNIVLLRYPGFLIKIS